MASDWTFARLESLCDPSRGITYGIVKVGDYVPGGVPVIRGGDIREGRIVFDDHKRVTQEVSNRFRRTILRGGEIVMNLISEPGHTAIVPKEHMGSNVSRDVAVVPLLSSVDHRFVDYCLKAPESVEWLTNRLQGSVTEKINLSTLCDLPIPLPPRPMQSSIARILGTLDDRIELNRRMNHTLEALARALFRSWFVDFDPVVAKAAGRKPVGMSAETARQFPEGFEESKMGPIPKGWRVGKLDEVAAINPRSIKADYPHQVIEYIDIASVSVGRLEGTTRYERSDAPSRAQRLIAHGDTLWSCVRPNRKSFLFVHRPAPNAVASTGFAVLTPKANAASFLYLWMTTDEFVDYLTAHAEGSAYPAVRPDSFAKAEVLIPRQPVLDAFERQVVPLFDRLGANESQSRTLAALRDALLPRLLSGELRVTAAEKTLR
jgi:type I restriction enzyme S subunit